MRIGTQRPSVGLSLFNLSAGGGGGTKHAYWRLNISAAQSGVYVSIAEIEFRSTPGGADQATGGTASASSEFNVSYPAINAFDDFAGSEWSSGPSFPHWVRYQFAAPVNVQQVVIQATDIVYGGPNERPKDFTIEYSDNDTDWTVAKTVTGQTGWADGELRSFSVP